MHRHLLLTVLTGTPHRGRLRGQPDRGRVGAVVLVADHALVHLEGGQELDTVAQRHEGTPQ